MSLVLPKPIAAYFAAENSDDTEALTQCFVDHAVVKDEGRTIEGLAAIKQWNVETKKKYQHTVEPIDAVERDGKTVVIGKVCGNFLNSTVTLEHIFKLEYEKIATVEIG